MICDAFPVRLDCRSTWLRGLRGIHVDEQLVEIVTTPCNFGGERRWLICPGCRRRCAILRAGLRCNDCLGGRHRSELKAPVDRMLQRARKLRNRLGETQPSVGCPIPDKPYRMRWHTYLRIRTEINQLEINSLKIRMRRYHWGA